MTDQRFGLDQRLADLPDWPSVADSFRQLHQPLFIACHRKTSYTRCSSSILFAGAYVPRRRGSNPDGRAYPEAR